MTKLGPYRLSLGVLRRYFVKTPVNLNRAAVVRRFPGYKKQNRPLSAFGSAFNQYIYIQEKSFAGLSGKFVLVLYKYIFSASRLLRVIDGAAFYDNVYFYMTGIFKLAFDFRDDIARDNNHLFVADLFRLYCDSNLAACLDSV